VERVGFEHHRGRSRRFVGALVERARALFEPAGAGSVDRAAGFVAEGLPLGSRSVAPVRMFTAPSFLNAALVPLKEVLVSIASVPLLVKLP
jgi:hypothetical protein